MYEYIKLAASDIGSDLSDDLGLFDRQGLLVSSYRRRGGAYEVFEYDDVNSGIICRVLIVVSEDLARAICEFMVDERNRRLPQPTQTENPFRNLLG
jgi:hypothetical protein